MGMLKLTEGFSQLGLINGQTAGRVWQGCPRGMVKLAQGYRQFAGSLPQIRSSRLNRGWESPTLSLQCSRKAHPPHPDPNLWSRSLRVTPLIAVSAATMPLEG